MYYTKAFINIYFFIYFLVLMKSLDSPIYYIIIKSALLKASSNTN